MSKTALFIRHQANPGRHDADVVRVFQLYPDRESMQTFLSGPWYPAELEKISPQAAAPLGISPAAPVWDKPPDIA